jgi:hypothetical protein
MEKFIFSSSVTSGEANAEADGVVVFSKEKSVNNAGSKKEFSRVIFSSSILELICSTAMSRLF